MPVLVPGSTYPKSSRGHIGIEPDLRVTNDTAQLRVLACFSVPWIVAGGVCVPHSLCMGLVCFAGGAC